MPIYEYVCEACGRVTESMQRVTDPPPDRCPACGAPKLVRLVSRTSFQLKGGGWYSDLYASPKDKAGPAANAAPAPSEKPASGDTGEKGGAAPAAPAAPGSTKPSG